MSNEPHKPSDQRSSEHIATLSTTPPKTRQGPDATDLPWLDRPGSGKKIYYALIAVCALLIAADALYHKHVHYSFEGWFGFYGFYGFIACVALVLAATQMRKFVMRDEDYYD